MLHLTEAAISKAKQFIETEEKDGCWESFSV